jgi:transcriptional regulator with XRE-family HTH domain
VVNSSKKPRVRHIAGENVRRVRQARGLSQRGLVARMNALGFENWHPATAHGVEKGTRQIPLDELLAIAVCLDTDLASLLDPVRAGVERVDVGMPWSLDTYNFRIIIPIPEEQGPAPRFARAVDWDEWEKSGELHPYSLLVAEMPAGESFIYQRGLEQHAMVQELKATVEELKATVQELKTKEGLGQ